jgi:hypothetical protein
MHTDLEGFAICLAVPAIDPIDDLDSSAGE